MDIENGTSLIIKGMEKQTEERAFKLYVSKYAMMDEKSYIPFEKFYQKPTQVEVVKPVENILNDVKDILNNYKI